jgi:predicted dehydrogenase
MGVVRKVLVEYLQGWLVLPEENRGSKQAAWRTNPAESGVGGAIGDIGTHALHLAEYVTGDPVVELCADKSTFLPNRLLDEDVNALLRFRGGGKGVLTVSQIATGEENALRLRIYASKGALLWEQENPNYLQLYRHGEPRQTLTRGRSEYLSSDAGAATRIPWGHPEGYLEAFANVYLGAIHAIRCHVDGAAIPRQAYDFPSVDDGCRGVRFIHRAVESANAGGTWVRM